VKPLAVLLSIVTGSALALAVSLGMTGIVFALLPEYSIRLAPEHLPLLKGLAWSWSLAAVSAAALIGEIKSTRWRRRPQLLLLAMLAVLAWRYWPA
jgi:hypothetical protein